MAIDIESVASARSQALATRAAWMRKMGFSENEILQACVDNGSPIDLKDEQEQLEFANRLKDATPSHPVLESWSVKR